MFLLWEVQEMNKNTPPALLCADSSLFLEKSLTTRNTRYKGWFFYASICQFYTFTGKKNANYSLQYNKLTCFQVKSHWENSVSQNAPQTTNMAATDSCTHVSLTHTLMYLCFWYCLLSFCWLVWTLYLSIYLSLKLTHFNWLFFFWNWFFCFQVDSSIELTL